MRSLFKKLLHRTQCRKEEESDSLLARQQQVLESLIQMEWGPAYWQSALDLRNSCIELERAGFSPTFNPHFSTFVRVLRDLYDNAIKGEDVAAILNGTKEPQDSRSMYLSTESFDSQLMVSPEEKYKLENPRYLLARTAKELVKKSAIGAAIAEYRKLHPLPTLGSFGTGIDYTTAGTQMSYYPTIFYELQKMQSRRDRDAQKPYLSGSDAGEGDFYYAAFDLIADELFPLLKVIEHNGYEDRGSFKAVTCSDVNYRIELLKPGLKIAERYTQKFLLAQRKLDTYGLEALGAYFVRGEVGEDGKEGQLRLFGVNPPKRTVYYG